MASEAATRHRAEPGTEELLRQVRPEALKILARHRIPAQDAEDVLQDTFLAFVERRDGIRNPSAWLQGTLRNRCRSYWRRRRYRRFVCLDRAMETVLGRAEPPAQEQVEHRCDLRRVIRGVSSVCREAIELRYFEGLSFEDTARRLGYEPSGIYKVMQRCLAALTTALTVRPDG